MSPEASKWVLGGIVAWTLVACFWFASAEPTSRRYWDERFGIANIEKTLNEGTLRPNNGWYGRLSYLPQAAVLAAAQSLHDAFGIERLRAFSNGRSTATSYLISRWITVGYGVIGLLVTFLVGRRVFSTGVALLGVSVLATTPWVLRHFVTFKPDALVMLLVLVTFSWSLDALERPSRAGFVLAGIGVGLAASAKYTGALAAFMVIVAALRTRDGWRRTVEHLAISGASSIAVFLALHPDVGYYLHFLRQQDQIYSANSGQSFASMLASEVSNLLHWSFHGRWLGLVALIGIAALCVSLLRPARRRDDAPGRWRLAMFLSFPLGFSIVYALATSLPKGNNYLIIVPFTSLAAAWLLCRAWEWLARRAPGPARRAILFAALAAFAVLEVWPANAYVYARTVRKTTLDKAGAAIREMVVDFSRGRAVVEAGNRALTMTQGGRSRLRVLHTEHVEMLTQLPEAELDLVDFEVFPEARLRGPDADFYLRRMGRLDSDAVVLLKPEWFEVSGPVRVLLVHPWRWAYRTHQVEWLKKRPKKGRFVGSLPERGLPARHPVSLEARIPRNAPPLTQVRVGDQELALFSIGWDQWGDRYSTRRFLLPSRKPKVVLQWDRRPAGAGAPHVIVLRWSRTPRRGPADVGPGLDSR